MEIKVLGPGCARCRQLEKDVRNLLGEINVATDLEKIEDMNEFAEYNVVVTPALVINGQVKMAGKVPTKGQLKEWIEEAANG
ncbi:MAG: TM0996/MTH895 family glutaredoxin-like protein [Firmicutes bacterium]|nr:TM0996/MTH895 family glutaredoxin-like protein [Bacillota bacterium]MBV1726539.1 TM0996/MTH895 family glutaredoxin-like protein [Desulforudis sp.]MBU4532648.1 TM0996/MTH895 family glutaredoxin-like protein [Bacillota bacterium]MBU4554695.1 TM0996/MTH895 family glutaredoxin-like protein [Bacillota bacterium]MBV1735254.1 TM0996/MTH895 family glutaredoxin-like protein [Desulforudis sp.]